MRCKQHIPLFKHQEKAIEANEDKDFFALLFDLGTGKSCTAIGILREKFAKERRYMKTLITCPLSIINQWKQEWIKFGGEAYKDIVKVVYGSSEKKVDILNEDGWIYITNIDSLNSKKVYAKLLAMNFEVIVTDESHQFKSIKSQRTKNLLKLAQGTKHRYILTGTPQTNGIEDLWSQFNFLCPGKIFHENFYVFRAMYFYDKNSAFRHKMGAKYFPKYVLRKELLPEIMEKIYTVSHVVKKQECLDLPPFIKMEKYVELTPEQVRLYKEMERDFIATLGERQSIAPIALTKGLRLQQLISGIFKDDQGLTSKIPNNRTEVLREILEEIDPNQKKIIWTCFVPTYSDIECVCNDLNLKYVLLTGEQNSTQKQENIDKFKTDPECNVLIANQASGGTGLNLTEASYSIYYTRDFNLEHDMQSEARNYRSGSQMHEKITRIDIVTRNTIDTTILKALREKKNLHEVLINYKGGNDVASI